MKLSLFENNLILTFYYQQVKIRKYEVYMENYNTNEKKTICKNKIYKKKVCEQCENN